MRQKVHLVRNVFIIVISLITGTVLASSGIFDYIIRASAHLGPLSSFVAGIFFASIFTAVPATLLLGTLTNTQPLPQVVIFGGLGALFGDFLIFHFVRENLRQDITYIFRQPRMRRFTGIFHLRLFNWMIPLIGAIIIASPLPDEIGLTMMGLTKMKTASFVPLSFFLNAIGILFIGLVARTLQ